MAFPDEWGRVSPVTFDRTKVSSDQTDIPILLTKDNLPPEMFDADGSYSAVNGGGDIRFTTTLSGATQIPCQIVSFVTDNTLMGQSRL